MMTTLLMMVMMIMILIHLRVNQLVQISGDIANKLGHRLQQVSHLKMSNGDHFTQADKYSHPSEEVAQWVPMCSSASPSSLTMMTTTSPKDRGKV